MDWMEEQHHQERAAKAADDLIARLKLKPPIDPLVVARTEREILRTGGCDLGQRYDGKLEYVRSRGLFLLYYNTKYDTGLPDGQHHPRTRFSISHELGHYFIDHHHQSLRRGTKPHRSLNEFQSHHQVEREADAFAASLIMPTAFAKTMVNASPLSMSRIDAIAAHFGASIISAAIRSVRLTDFPCAVAGIRNGAVAWTFPSAALLDAGIYPARDSLPSNAAGVWTALTSGVTERFEGDGTVSDWFQTYRREELDDIYVCEEYHPVLAADTLLVLLTIDEADLAADEDDCSDDE